MAAIEAHGARVMPKRRKIEEASVPYAAKAKGKNPTQPQVRFADLEEVRKTNAKLMQTHQRALQKLAQ